LPLRSAGFSAARELSLAALSIEIEGSGIGVEVPRESTRVCHRSSRKSQQVSRAIGMKSSGSAAAVRYLLTFT